MNAVRSNRLLAALALVVVFLFLFLFLAACGGRDGRAGWTDPAMVGSAPSAEFSAGMDREGGADEEQADHRDLGDNTDEEQTDNRDLGDGADDERLGK